MRVVDMKNPIHERCIATMPEVAAKMSRAAPMKDDRRAYCVAVYFLLQSDER